MAMPNVLKGDAVKMLLRGGMWDSLKRVLVWNAKELKIGTELGLINSL